MKSVMGIRELLLTKEMTVKMRTPFVLALTIILLLSVTACVSTTPRSATSTSAAVSTAPEQSPETSAAPTPESSVAPTSESSAAPTPKTSDQPDPQTASEAPPEPTPDVIEEQTYTVSFEIDGETYLVEVSGISADDNNRPTVTLTSDSILGSIAMYDNQVPAMTPFVACAVLSNNSIVEPILMAGGVVDGTGYTSDGGNMLVKVSYPNALGRWDDGRQGYLRTVFCCRLLVEHPFNFVLRDF